MKTNFITVAFMCFLTHSFADTGRDIIPVVDRKKSVITELSITDLNVLTKNLEYDFSKASIRSVYYQKLDQLAKVLAENGYALSVRGYADSIGAYKANWVLSDKRAGEVKEYLVKKGVAENLIVATPFGSTLPIASNKTVAGRQKNRRVEFKLTKINE